MLGVTRMEGADVNTMQELISRLSRDIDFEVTIGCPLPPPKSVLMEENYKTLLRLRKTYEIPRLEKDVIVLPP